MVYLLVVLPTHHRDLEIPAGCDFTSTACMSRKRSKEKCSIQWKTIIFFMNVNINRKWKICGESGFQFERGQ